MTLVTVESLSDPGRKNNSATGVWTFVPRGICVAIPDELVEVTAP